MLIGHQGRRSSSNRCPRCISKHSRSFSWLFLVAAHCYTRVSGFRCASAVSTRAATGTTASTDKRNSAVIGRTEKRWPAAGGQAESLIGPGRAGPGLQPTVTGLRTTTSRLFPLTLVAAARQSPQTRCSTSP